MCSLFCAVPVSVHVQPSIEVHLENTAVSLLCQYEGFPAPKVTWSFEGRTLVNGIGIFNTTMGIGNNAFLLFLDIHDVSFNDAGKYECNGTNNLTRLGVQISTSSVVLIVQGEM